jgi:uncharacterized protein YkwD
MGSMRTTAACLVFVGALATVPAVAATQRPARNGAPASASITLEHDLDAAILTRINAVRGARGLRQIKLNAHLAAAAASHSRELAMTGLFQHESADGAPFWKRVERYYPSAGFRTWNVGETLLWWSPETDAATTVADWLASPPHRKILLSPVWREIGVSAVHDPGAPGAYHGLEVTIVTADFGARTR